MATIAEHKVFMLDLDEVELKLVSLTLLNYKLTDLSEEKCNKLSSLIELLPNQTKQQELVGFKPKG